MNMLAHVSANSGLHRPPALPTVFIIDPDLSVRNSLERLIRRAGWYPRILTSAEEFLAEPRALGMNCLVSDVSLPGLSGLQLQSQLADRPEMPLIFLASHFDVSITVQAMKAGAVEFLTKPFNDNTMLNAIHSALERSRIVIRRETELRTLRERYAALSPREREVMSLVVSGLLNKQVGGRLCITEITVKVHRGRVMRKMGVGSFAQLVNVAAKLERATLSRIDPHSIEPILMPRPHQSDIAYA